MALITDTALPAPPTITIDLHSALRSTLRAWLASRDELLWVVCSGTDADNPLESLDTDDLKLAAGQMNRLRDVARHFALQIAGKERGIAAVLSDAIADLLVSESPKFLLTSGVEGSF